jgi:membrane protein DedA with SNARE-associated domain
VSAGNTLWTGPRLVLTRMLLSRTLRIAVPAAIGLAAVAAFAILEGDLPELFDSGVRTFRHFLHVYSYAPGFALLYIEESGIPLPAPGDVFVLYVGSHVPHNPFAWIAAWLGLIAVVVLGATNLFLISRKAGRKLAESRIASYIHLSPERLARAEQWFARYGVLAIIFGRHIPGFRIPITVAAGVFRVRYPVFAMSVAISTAIWAGVVIIIGINFGTRLEAFLALHREMYLLWGAAVILLVAAHVVRERVRKSRAPAIEEPSPT